MGDARPDLQVCIYLADFIKVRRMDLKEPLDLTTCVGILSAITWGDDSLSDDDVELVSAAEQAIPEPTGDACNDAYIVEVQNEAVAAGAQLWAKLDRLGRTAIKNNRDIVKMANKGADTDDLDVARLCLMVLKINELTNLVIVDIVVIAMTSLADRFRTQMQSRLQIFHSYRGKMVYFDLAKVQRVWKAALDHVGAAPPLPAIAAFKCLLERLPVHGLSANVVCLPNMYLLSQPLHDAQAALELASSNQARVTAASVQARLTTAALSAFQTQGTLQALYAASTDQAHLGAASASGLSYDQHTDTFTWTVSKDAIISGMRAVANGTDIASLDLARQKFLIVRHPDITDEPVLLKHALQQHDDMLASLPHTAAAPAQLAYAEGLVQRITALLASKLQHSEPWTVLQDATFKVKVVEAAALEASTGLPITPACVEAILKLVAVYLPDKVVMGNVLLAAMNQQLQLPADSPPAQVPDSGMEVYKQVVEHKLSALGARLNDANARSAAIQQCFVAFLAFLAGKNADLSGVQPIPINERTSEEDRRQIEGLNNLRERFQEITENVEGGSAPQPTTSELLGLRLSTRTAAPVASGPAPGTPSTTVKLDTKPFAEPTLDVHGDPNDFFTRIELVFDMNHTPLDQRITRAVLKIKSTVITSQWFQYVNAAKRPVTWQEFKEQILLYTRGHNIGLKAMDNLSSCVQGFSSVDAYAARYSKLVVLLERTDRASL